jgi:hypothetical protein
VFSWAECFLEIPGLFPARAIRPKSLISEQFSQLVARGRLARMLRFLRGVYAFDEVKVFAKVPGVFFGDRLGAPIAALLRRPRIVAGAVEANPQIGQALVAAFPSSRLSRESPFGAALVTMTGHNRLFAPGGVNQRFEFLH